MRLAATVLLLLPLTLGACKKKALGADEVALASDASGSGTKVPATQAEAIAELSSNFRKVLFALDSSVLDGESQQRLSANAAILKAHPDLVVEIQGHADERGTVDYNLALGEKRAASVRTFLLAQGVSKEAVRTVSYGEERPAVQGEGESVWSENRRAEFRILVGEGVAGSVP